MTPQRCRRVFAALGAACVPQESWPAQTPFEVMVRAVFTHNTAWTYVERAQERLGARCPLDAGARLTLPEPELAEVWRLGV